MSVVLWPSELPDKVQVSGFGIETGNTVIESEMEVGPAKVRKHSTTDNDTMSISFLIPFSDYSLMDLFFKNTLAGGSIFFQYNHPITQEPTVFRWVGSPNYKPVGSLQLSVSGKWEQQYAVA